MGSFLDAITGGSAYGPGPGMVWRNGQWVPYQIASPGGPGDAAHDSWTRAEENRFRTISTQSQSRTRMRTNTDAGSSNPYGLPDNPTQGAFSGGVDGVIRAKYGQLAGFINHPEIGPLLKKAAAEGWGEPELYGAVVQTTWWKNTSAAQRTWWQLTNDDPAEAKRLVAQTAASMQNRARSLGLGISSSAIAGLATQATANGWTDAQTVDQLLQQVNWATLEAGDLTALRDDVRAVAGDYLVGVSEETARSYAQRIASGEMSMDGVRSAMLKQAKARFGWMADQLDQGITVKDYFRPTRDVIANELGIPPEEVDLTDSKYLSLVEKRDEKTGELRAATLDEAMLSARRDPRFQNTEKAKEMTSSMINMVANMFGRQ